VQSTGKHGSNRESSLISVKETAALLECSPLTVYRRYHSGLFPGRKVGRKIDLHRPFVAALHTAIRSGRNVDVEAFAADWITRHGMPEAVAS
jgi:hypothetical protein